MAQQSILITAIFGLLSSLMVAFTGDSSSRTIAKVQPMKFAAMEAHYDGTKNAGLVAFGILKDSDKTIGEKKIKDFVFKIQIPGFLSVLTGGDKDTFVPGINDLVTGGTAGYKGLTVGDKISRGTDAKDVLNDYKRAKMVGNKEQLEYIKEYFRDRSFVEENLKYFGYAFLDRPEDAIPNVSISFYSFHIMVILGFFFILVCLVSLILVLRGTLPKYKWFLWIVIISIPLVYIAGESGWVLAEMGRQPWIIQDLMPVNVAVSQISTGSVITTFILFAVFFTALLIAEVSIMIKQIKSGPKH